MRAVVREPEPDALKDWETYGQRLCEALKRYHRKERATKPEADAKIYRDQEVLKALWQMFQGRCAYCESVLPGKLDVEHFRPESLYPMLAYKWTNLLFACAFCNQGDAKGAKFPLSADGRQPLYDPADPGKRDDTDTGMLINPCEEDPAEFFEFTGAVLACKNERAKKMREVCRLDRPDLMSLRLQHLRNVGDALKGWEIAMLLGDDNERLHSEQRLRQFLGWEIHPGDLNGQPYTMMTCAYLQSQGFDVQVLQS